jgi:pimeloyl-ACP methyl ester carboxylesterase
MVRQRKTPLPARGRHERIALLPALDLPTGVRIHYDDDGPPDAPPLLLLHGWPQDARAWRRVVDELGMDHRILRPDNRGFGRSGWPDDGDFTKDRLADDALALLDALGIERVLLAGHDWGGWAAILLALRAPERVERLLAMSIPHPWQPPRQMARHGWRLAYQLPLSTPVLGPRLLPKQAALMLKAGWGDKSTWDEEMAREYVRMTERCAEASHRLYRNFLVREIGRGVRGRRLQMPSTLLFGRRDGLGPAWTEGFERHVDAEARVEILDGAGHFLPEERPELVAAAMRG